MRQRDLEQWHRALAGVVGELSQKLTKRNLRRGDLVGWQSILERVSREMQEETREQMDLLTETRDTAVGMTQMRHRGGTR